MICFSTLLVAPIPIGILHKKLRLFIVLFCIFDAKFIDMETIVVNVESKSKAKRILDAIKLLNGVTNAAIIDDESTKISKAEFMADFRKSLTEVKEKKTKPLKELLNFK